LSDINQRGTNEAAKRSPEYDFKPITIEQINARILALAPKGSPSETGIGLGLCKSDKYSDKTAKPDGTNERDLMLALPFEWIHFTLAFCRFLDCAGMPFGVMLLALRLPILISEWGCGGVASIRLIVASRRAMVSCSLYLSSCSLSLIEERYHGR
jgi:hypothetical protein